MPQGAPPHHYSKYERAEIIALRAALLADGAPILLDEADELVQAHASTRDATLDIARREFELGKLQVRARHRGDAGDDP